MFIRKSGAHNIEWYPKKASQAMAIGDLVYPDGSGAVQLADSTSGEHIGIVMKKVASTDSDYASTTKIPVDVVGPEDLFIADVGTGTLTTAMIGNYYDLKDENEIDVTAQAKKVVLIVGYISATKAVVKITASAGVKYVATT